jgi:hypothetical protein
VSAAIGGRVPVGNVTFGMESLVGAAEAHQARRSGRPTHWGLLDDGTTGQRLAREHGPHRWTALELSALARLRRRRWSWSEPASS